MFMRPKPEKSWPALFILLADPAQRTVKGQGEGPALQKILGKGRTKGRAKGQALPFREGKGRPYQLLGPTDSLENFKFSIAQTRCNCCAPEHRPKVLY